MTAGICELKGRENLLKLTGFTKINNRESGHPGWWHLSLLPGVPEAYKSKKRRTIWKN